ncbi:MAG: hypothetical protein SA339_02010 [Methanomassiliicoccus sp.]|nr:hypothetical protein [Methanomassiliicoccus sp.]
MTKSNEDLIREINELRNEMKQMKEVLNVLFSLVVEADEGDDDEIEYPTFVQDIPRINN